MIAIIDYGVGNLFSLLSSLRAVGAEAEVTNEPEKIKAADRLILPGVGAFEDAVGKLRKSGLDEVVREEAALGKPLLGICLGMQMLFEKSYEFGEHKGLRLIPGEVVPMKGRIDENLKIPHIGWNFLKIEKESPIFKDIKTGDAVYFVHSFYAAGCRPYVIATTDYGIEMTAAAANENVFGCQFHPEKSGAVGLKILKNFCDL